MTVLPRTVPESQAMFANVTCFASLMSFVFSSIPALLIHSLILWGESVHKTSFRFSCNALWPSFAPKINISITNWRIPWADVCVIFKPSLKVSKAIWFIPSSRNLRRPFSVCFARSFREIRIHLLWQSKLTGVHLAGMCWYLVLSTNICASSPFQCGFCCQSRPNLGAAIISVSFFASASCGRTSNGDGCLRLTWREPALRHENASPVIKNKGNDGSVKI